MVHHSDMLFDEEPDAPRPLSGFRLRRAVLGVLIGRGGPMTTAEIAAELLAMGFASSPHRSKSTRRMVANLLGYQAQLGHVYRTAPGTYRVNPEWVAGLSKATRWRYLNWRRLT
ncbi:MAG: hypothetical protein ACKORC_05320 [Acidimicrobiia bacterium]